MHISINIPFGISLYLLSIILNATLMRKLLKIDRKRIESYLDIVISIGIILLPIIGAIIIKEELNGFMTIEERAKNKITAKKIADKIFFIK